LAVHRRKQELKSWRRKTKAVLINREAVARVGAVVAVSARPALVEPAEPDKGQRAKNGRARKIAIKSKSAIKALAASRDVARVAATRANAARATDQQGSADAVSLIAAPPAARRVRVRVARWALPKRTTNRRPVDQELARVEPVVATR
jgi:hypothetical protein